jgi:hypothetical protein
MRLSVGNFADLLASTYRLEAACDLAVWQFDHMRRETVPTD